MLYNTFQLARKPQKCPFMWEIYIPVKYMLPGSTRLIIPNCILIGSAIFAQLTAESPYITMCVKMWLTRYAQFKKLIAVINIRKINRFTALVVLLHSAWPAVAIINSFTGSVSCLALLLGPSSLLSHELFSLCSQQKDNSCPHISKTAVTKPRKRWQKNLNAQGEQKIHRFR